MCLVYPVCGRVAVSTRGALGAQAVRLGFGKVDTCGWVGVQMGRCADGSAFGLVGVRSCVVWCWVVHVNCGHMTGEQRPELCREGGVHTGGVKSDRHADASVSDGSAGGWVLFFIISYSLSFHARPTRPRVT